MEYPRKGNLCDCAYFAKIPTMGASSFIQIMVLTDHESLQHWYTEDLNKATSSVGRRCRWHEFLSQFNLVVVYVPGSTQRVADPLSRAPWHQPAVLDDSGESDLKLVQ